MQKNNKIKEIELVKCIQDTKRNLNTANKNFETANAEIIAYYANEIIAEKTNTETQY